MAISSTPSSVFVPADTNPEEKVVDFLVQKFPHISRDAWLARLAQNKVLCSTGRLINASSLCVANTRLLYFREVESEKTIPFKEAILYQDERILVVDKPHFLPVVPGGRYVEQCLLHRLRVSTGIESLTPAHRIDLDTAGLVLFVKNEKHRALYHQLFADKRIYKRYLAVVELTKNSPSITVGQRWEVKLRMASAVEPKFWMSVVPGEVNSHSEIRCLHVNADRAFFELSPVTGKKHQLRLHMAHLGLGLSNDRFYPQLQPEVESNYDRPLQLLASGMSFIDPYTGDNLEFSTRQRLLKWYD